MSRILYQGLLRSPASWARVGRGYLKGLSEHGQAVRAVSVRGFRYDPSFPIPEAIQEVSVEEARSGDEPEIGLGFLHPPNLGRLLGRRKINLFVCEADRVSELWADALARGTDLVVVPSRFSRQALLASGLAAEKIAVVPYGYDPPRRDSPQHDPDGEGDRDPGDDGDPRPSRPFTFLAVMAPHWRKGPRELLAAFRSAFQGSRDRDGDVLLRIKTTYDPGASRRRKAFEIPSWAALLRETGFGHSDDPRVEIDVETLADHEMGRLYAAADVVVQPSWGESFGLATLEAMAAGLAVITTDWSGHLDFVPRTDDLLPFELVEAGTALYEPVSGARLAVPRLDALVERLRWHRAHPAESRSLGERCRDHVEPLTWNAAARELLKLLG